MEAGLSPLIDVVAGTVALPPPESGFGNGRGFGTIRYSVGAVSALHIMDNALGSTRELERKSSIAVLSPRLLKTRVS